MICELRSGENFLEFSDFRHFAEDEANGNPYNFSFTAYVSSDGFTGHTNWECDRKEFLKFVQHVQDLYEFLNITAWLNDSDWGSSIRLEPDKTGHITASGTLYGFALDNSLNFRFIADQTDLRLFLEKLQKISADYKSARKEIPFTD